MRSDNLIKKLLKAAGICEAVFFGLTFLLFLFSGRLITSFLMIGVEIAPDIAIKAYLPEIERLIVMTAGFFGIWHLFNKAVDPKQYRSILGILLVIFDVISGISGYAISLLINVLISRKYGMEYYAGLVSMSSFISLIGVFDSAAMILMWIVLGMEWYRDRLIREQAMLAAQATAQAAAENTAEESNTADPTWDSYRNSLVKEQATAEPSQEYIFNNKP